MALSFRMATTKMSATKQPTLLSTHAGFEGLQDHLAKELLSPTCHRRSYGKSDKYSQEKE